MAILDEYQNVVLLYADWSRVARRAEITVFNQAVIGPLTRFGERSPPLAMPTWCQGWRATAQAENETPPAPVPVARQGGRLIGGPHQRTIKEPDP